MNCDKKISRFGTGWAIFAFAMYAISWRLGSGLSPYPQIPLTRFAALVPAWADLVAYGCLILSFLGVAILGFRKSDQSNATTNARPVILVNILAGAWLFMSNQHRLQPWAYLAWLVAWALLMSRPDKSLRWLRAIAISVYLYSALTKFDYQFLHTLGQQFLNVLNHRFGLPLDQLEEGNRILLSGTFPVVELLIGIGLTFAKSRRIAVILAIAMHAALLLILSPLGLNHKPTVLLWNVYFIWQAWALFWPSRLPETTSDMGESTQNSGTLDWIPGIVLAAAMILPLTQPFGLFDHWPSWGLYAPSNDRVDVFVAEDQIQKLPEPLRQYCKPLAFHDPEFDIPMQRFRYDWWSLGELNVPLYPQQRFQLAVALSLSEQFDEDDAIQIVLQSRSNRWNGERTTKRLDNQDAIRAAADTYFFNATPR